MRRRSPAKGAKRASAQRRSLLCSAGTPSPTPSWHRPAGPPLFRQHRAFANAAEKGSCCPKRFPLAPSGGTTYCFGGRGLNSVPAPAVLYRDTIPRTGAAPTHGSSPFSGGTGPLPTPRRGAVGGPKRYPLPPAGGTTYCFGGRSLNSAPAPTGRGRLTPLPPSGRSRRSPGRKTGYHTVPGGGWRVTKGGIPLHQGVDRLQCTSSPSNLPDRQQKVQHFFLLLTGRAIDWSPPSRKDLTASWQSVGFSLRHGAFALPPATCHRAATRHLVRCGNT